VTIHGDSAAVVDHGDGVVDVDGHVDLIAMTRERLVYRVVDDLVNEVMEAGRAGRSDVHRRPLAHGLEAFEDLDLVRPVIVCTGTISVTAGGNVLAFGQRRLIWGGFEFSEPRIVVRWFEL
jgi:hypothetical protein